MSTLTTNYGLIKPQRSDAADIEATNVNWNKLDILLKELEENVDFLNHTYQPKITYDISLPSDGEPGDIHIQLLIEE